MKLIANHAQTYYLIIIVCSGSFFLCVNSTVPTTVCIHMILTNNITHSQSACLFGLWSYTLQCIWCVRYKYRMESVYCWRYRVSRFTFFFSLLTNVPLNEMDANIKSNYIYFDSLCSHLFDFILFLVVVFFHSLGFCLLCVMRFDFAYLKKNKRIKKQHWNHVKMKSID